MRGAPADDARVNEWHAALTQKCAGGEPYTACGLFDAEAERLRHLALDGIAGGVHIQGHRATQEIGR